MRMDKCTIKAQESLAKAQELAQRFNNPEIRSLHLLTALVGESDGVVVPLLQKVGANVQRITSIAQSELDKMPKSSGIQLQISREIQDLFAEAQKEADALKDEYISTEHLLLALAEVPSDAKQILSLNAVDHDRILAALKDVRGGQRVTDQNPRSQVPGAAAVWAGSGGDGATGKD